jgi:hypothetical protein
MDVLEPPEPRPQSLLLLFFGGVRSLGIRAIRYAVSSQEAVLRQHEDLVDQART